MVKELALSEREDGEQKKKKKFHVSATQENLVSQMA